MVAKNVDHRMFRLGPLQQDFAVRSWLSNDTVDRFQRLEARHVILDDELRQSPKFVPISVLEVDETTADLDSA